jgi:adenylate cyclase
MSDSKKAKNNKRPLFFSLIYSGCIIVVMFLAHFSGVFEQMEDKFLDFRFRYFNQHLEVDKDLVFIDVDEYSLGVMSSLYGGWPWPRASVFGQIVDYMMEGNPSAVLFDVLFTELSSKRLDEEINMEDSDFAAISSVYGNLSHAAIFSNISSVYKTKPLPESAEYNFEIKVDDSKAKIKIPELNDNQMPYQLLNDCAAAVHLVNHIEDGDGISRRCNILLKYQGKYYPGLALRALMFKLQPTEMVLEDDDLHLIRDGKLLVKIPLDKEGRFRINFYDTLERFAHNTLSAIGIYQSAQLYHQGVSVDTLDYPPAFFKDKIIVIGSSANGLKDNKVTPMGKNFAGPFIHISAISNVLNKQRLYVVSDYIWLIIIALCVIMMSLLVVYVKNRFFKNIFGAVFIFAIMLAELLLFRFFGILLPMLIPLLAMVLTYLGTLVFISFSEEAEKKRVQTAMGKYLAPSVMNEVLKNYDSLVGEVGKKKDITVLFSDIRSFTTFSERYSPEVVVSILNRYLEKMIDVIFDFNGTLDKIVGDEIMAFWGAPTDDEKQAYNAVRAAIVMQEKLQELNEELKAEGYPALANGVGINSGDMIVGNIGSAKRLDYTLIGDNVNLGARVEGLTKYYKVKVLITESTYQKVKEQYLCAFLDVVAVKGKAQGVRIYTPLAEYGEYTEQTEKLEMLEKEAKAFKIALSFYFKKDFEKSKQLFDKGTRAFKVLNELAAVFVERCEYFTKNPPPADWNGTWTMSDK